VTEAESGEARLFFKRRGSRTMLNDCYCRSPLRVSRPLATNDGVEARVLLLTSGGGLLGGDRSRIEVACGVGARVYIGTVGAARLLPSDLECTQVVTLRLESGSSLTYLPEPLIPCAGARYAQHTVVHLAADSSAVIGEIIAPGRLGSGERFAYRQLTLGTRVLRAGRLVLVDRLCFEPGLGHLDTLLGGHTHLANLLLLGPAATRAMATALYSLISERSGPAGVSEAAEGVLVVRALGGSAHELQGLIRIIVQCFNRLTDFDRLHSASSRCR
jgi:urease accessory protein